MQIYEIIFENQKMITLQQFDEALKTISDYKLQLENGVFQNAPKGITVDIQKKISKHTFLVLQNYFVDHLNQDLKLENLKAIELETMNTIDFKKLRMYRGFGIMAEKRLKNTIKTFFQ